MTDARNIGVVLDRVDEIWLGFERRDHSENIADCVLTR